MKPQNVKPSNGMHIAETDLALYVSGDLSLLERLSVRFHVRGCNRCNGLVEKYRADRLRVKELVDEMPEGVNWDRMVAEMTANIRVGLAAGECVARPNRSRHQIPTAWRFAATAAGAVVLLSVAWLLNMPSGTTDELGRAMTAILHGRGSVIAPGSDDYRRPVVVATQQGVELRQNNNSMGGSDDAQPVAVTVSMQGSASARYVNAGTDQITITSVYVQ